MAPQFSSSSQLRRLPLDPNMKGLNINFEGDHNITGT
jgi:hypothetical protein